MWFTIMVPPMGPVANLMNSHAARCFCASRVNIMSITNEHAALIGRFKRRDEPQQGGLAATGRTKDREKIAIPDLHRDNTQSLRRTELLRNVPKQYSGHQAPSNPSMVLGG
jgi:hypothetical protein